MFKNSAWSGSKVMKSRLKLLAAGLGLFISIFQTIGQSFPLAALPVVGTNPIVVMAADVNIDGKMDLISLSGITNLVTVLTNNGAGGFGSNATIKAGLTGIFANSFNMADINGDGRADLICSLTTGFPNYFGRLLVFTNNGGGIFVSNATLVVGTNPVSVAVADINGDGRMDLVSANVGAFPNYHTLSILTNNGSGIFRSNATLNVGSGPQSVTASDISGDGRVDLISANFYDNTLSILTNNGVGRYLLQSSPNVGGYPLMVISTDVNGDGAADLVSANSGDATLSILTNNGTGKMSLASTLGVGLTPYSVAGADVNGDGKVDLISANKNAATLTVLTNNGTGGFTIAGSPAVGPGPFYITTADVSGDGRLDLISANTGSNTLSVLTNALTFLPQLALKRSSNIVVVSWPSQWTGWAGWTLQQNTNLDSASWGSFNGPIGDDGAIITATNSMTVSNLFFRLAHP